MAISGGSAVYLTALRALWLESVLGPSQGCVSNERSVLTGRYCWKVARNVDTNHLFRLYVAQDKYTITCRLWKIVTCSTISGKVQCLSGTRCVPFIDGLCSLLHALAGHFLRRHRTKRHKAQSSQASMHFLPAFKSMMPKLEFVPPLLRQRVDTSSDAPVCACKSMHTINTRGCHKHASSQHTPCWTP